MNAPHPRIPHPGPAARPRRGIALTPMETRRSVIVDMAVLADELGYELFSVPEGWGFDSTLVLTEIALKTKRLRPMSGILSVWSRTPGAIAMNAATLYDISGGRYVLGLGASTKALAEGFHGVPFTRPRRKLTATVDEVRRLLAGERADLPDAIETRPLRLGQKPAPGLPIFIAAIGPKTVRDAARHGDGWFPYYVTRDRFAVWAPELREVRRAAGLDPAAFTVLGGPTVSVKADAAAARQAVATNVAWYITAMGDVYANSLRKQGHARAVEEVIAANPKPSPSQGVVPETAEVLLDQLTAYGDPDRVAAQLAKWDARVDVNMIGLAPGAPWDEIEAILQASAPAAASSGVTGDAA